MTKKEKKKLALKCLKTIAAIKRPDEKVLFYEVMLIKENQEPFVYTVMVETQRDAYINACDMADQNGYDSVRIKLVKDSSDL